MFQVAMPSFEGNRNRKQKKRQAFGPLSTLTEDARLSPTLTCGVFVFSVVSAPPSSALLLVAPPPRNFHQPIVTNQLLPTNCHQPIASNQLPPTNCHPQTSTNQLPPTNFHQPIVINQLRPTAVICVAGVALGALQGVGCTPRGRPGARHKSKVQPVMNSLKRVLA